MIPIKGSAQDIAFQKKIQHIKNLVSHKKAKVHQNQINSFTRLTEFYNENHDEKGRFAPEEGSNEQGDIPEVEKSPYLDEGLASEAIKNASPEEQHAVVEYTTHSGSFNNNFRKDKPPAASRAAQIETLDGLIAKSIVSEETTLYRGVKGKFAQTIMDLPLGATLKDKGYTSATGDLEAAKIFAEDPGTSNLTVMNLVLPKGSKAINIGGEEYETIIARGGTWVKTARMVSHIVNNRPTHGPQFTLQFPEEG